MAQHPQEDGEPPGLFDDGRSARRNGEMLAKLRSWLPPFNYITLHYAYFIVGCLVASVIFWGSSDPHFRVSYPDSLFMVVSAMTETGLNTVNLSQLTTWQQVLLWLLILLGGSVWVSIWTVVARKHVFEKRFQDIVRAERSRGRHRHSSRASSDHHHHHHHHHALRMKHPAVFRRHERLSPPVHDTAHVQLEEGKPTSPSASALPSAGGRSSSQVATSGHAHSGHVAFLVDGSRSPADSGGGGAAAAAAAAATSSGAHLSGAYAPPNRRTTAAGVSHVAYDDDGPKPRGGGIHHLLSTRSVGRNGQFHDLTTEERDELGGYEYRALKLLATVVPLYSFLWQFLGCVSLGAWINNHLPEPVLANGIHPWWAGIFNGASAFNNSGMSVVDANMTIFQNSYFVLITMGLMILAGNTAYPIFLRLIIWSLLKALTLATDDEAFCDLKETLRFILKYPRRVYTNLFPSRPTWWLLFMVVLLNSIDWIGFELLNLGNPVIEQIPPGPRILDGLFQGIAVRSGGFYVVPISSVYIGLQLLYVIMMYISVYPVVITMRHSNVYEERSLGIYAGDEPTHDDSDPEAALPLAAARSHPRRSPPPRRRGSASTVIELTRAVGRNVASLAGVSSHTPASAAAATASSAAAGSGVSAVAVTTRESRISFISQQIRGQLAHDLWWLVLAVLAITTIETSHFNADPVAYSVFNVIFEVVSAYGCVGISVGLPDRSYSFSGGCHTASKLLLCLVMIRGRHRGLPVALDRAVRLPGEQLHRDEEEDYRIRRSVTSRRVSYDG